MSYIGYQNFPRISSSVLLHGHWVSGLWGLAFWWYKNLELWYTNMEDLRLYYMESLVCRYNHGQWKREGEKRDLSSSWKTPKQRSFLSGPIWVLWDSLYPSNCPFYLWAAVESLHTFFATKWFPYRQYPKTSLLGPLFTLWNSICGAEAMLCVQIFSKDSFYNTRLANM